MLVAVDWHSTYRYDPPVRLLNMELHVMPASGGGQQLVEGELTVDPPAPVRVHAHADAFGNTMHGVSLLGPAPAVRIALRARVSTAAGPVAAPTLTPLLRTLALRPSDRAPHDDPRLHALAEEAGDPGDPVAYAERLEHLIADHFTYATGQSAVDDTAIDFLDRGRGVCQDYAHLMLAALRLRGIPALYVGGYLAPADGVAVAEAGHAWVRVLAGGAWHGFDPSNRCREDERYVVTAVGRDYGDAAPVRGAYHGPTDESWITALRVETLARSAAQQ